jgi:hypothetical protein
MLLHPGNSLFKTTLGGALGLPAEHCFGSTIVSAEPLDLAVGWAYPLLVRVNGFHLADQFHNHLRQVSNRDLVPGANINHLADGCWAFRHADEASDSVGNIVEVAGRSEISQADDRLGQGLGDVGGMTARAD